jgi:preprotein translocase subunit SecE
VAVFGPGAAEDDSLGGPEMKNISEQLSSLRAFFGDVGVEMHKCSWPERQELLESTAVVIVSVVLISVFVGLSDKILVVLLRLLVRTG